MAIDVRGVCALLQVFDMPTSIKFYRDVLGFEVVQTSEPGEHFDWAFLKLNEAKLMLNTAYESHARPPAPVPARIDAHDDIGLFFSCPDVDRAYQHLRKQNLEVKEPKITGYGMKQLYVKDPDGYCLCFQWAAT